MAASAFSKLVKKQRPPGRTLVLETWVFADDWESRPKAAVCVGLVRMSEQSKTTARHDAEKTADELHPRGGANWIDCFNDHLIRQVVAHGICDPNDVDKPSPTLQMAQDMVGHALTSRGARFIFDAIDRFEIETSPIGVAANREEVERLCELLGKVDLERLSGSTRRMLSHLLEQVEVAS
jgi:hypothetical protein